MVPPLYEDSFKKAMLTSLYQRVYDPVKEEIVHLSNLAEYIDEDLEFLGPYPYVTIFGFLNGHNGSNT